ncbi:hypothetical protein Mapa_018677 [Marchantia paleacea]|nr:hypothetical protein Mapa_018677 [Marchantia paleacea]
MIFLPVSPASPRGPPLLNCPEGLMWKTVFPSRYLSGITGLITCSRTSAAISSFVTVSSCWVEIRTV